MVLFIDRLPLYAYVKGGPLATRRMLAACLPIVPTELHRTPSPRARPQRWAFDSRFTGEAYAWRHHLLEAGLDPHAQRVPATYLTPVGGRREAHPVRAARLWLCSNIPALRQTPWPLQLREGIAFRDRQELPDPDTNMPLLGMRALERAGLRITLDFAAETLSVWVPGSWLRRLGLFLQGLPTGFTTESIAWYP